VAPPPAGPAVVVAAAAADGFVATPAAGVVAVPAVGVAADAGDEPAAVPAVPAAGAVAVPAAGRAVPPVGAPDVPTVGLVAVPPPGPPAGLVAVPAAGRAAVPAAGLGVVPAAGVAADPTAGVVALEGGEAAPSAGAVASAGTAPGAAASAGAAAVAAGAVAAGAVAAGAVAAGAVAAGAGAAGAAGAGMAAGAVEAAPPASAGAPGCGIGGMGGIGGGLGSGGGGGTGGGFGSGGAGAVTATGRTAAEDAGDSAVGEACPGPVKAPLTRGIAVSSPASTARPRGVRSRHSRPRRPFPDDGAVPNPSGGRPCRSSGRSAGVQGISPRAWRWFLDFPRVTSITSDLFHTISPIGHGEDKSQHPLERAHSPLSVVLACRVEHGKSSGATDQSGRQRLHRAAFAAVRARRGAGRPRRRPADQAFFRAVSTASPGGPFRRLLREPKDPPCAAVITHVLA
jgi:hypothetical protein